MTERERIEAAQQEPAVPTVRVPLDWVVEKLQSVVEWVRGKVKGERT